MLEHVADLADRADTSQARVLASGVDAGQVDWAFGITLTRHLTFRTNEISSGRDDQLVLAGARGLVSPSHALLVGVADRGVAAGRVALTAVAVEAGVAVVIGQALLASGRLFYHRACVAQGIWLALEHGLADEALRAFAPGPMQDHPTDGVLTTGSPE